MRYYLLNFSNEDETLTSYEIIDEEELNRRAELIKNSDFSNIHINIPNFEFDFTKDQLLRFLDCNDSEGGVYEISEIEFISFKSIFFGWSQIGIDVWEKIEEKIPTT